MIQNLSYVLTLVVINDVPEKVIVINNLRRFLQLTKGHMFYK